MLLLKLLNMLFIRKKNNNFNSKKYILNKNKGHNDTYYDILRNITL